MRVKNTIAWREEARAEAEAAAAFNRYLKAEKFWRDICLTHEKLCLQCEDLIAARDKMAHRAEAAQAAFVRASEEAGRSKEFAREAFARASAARRKIRDSFRR